MLDHKSRLDRLYHRLQAVYMSLLMLEVQHFIYRFRLLGVMHETLSSQWCLLNSSYVSINIGSLQP